MPLRSRVLPTDAARSDDTRPDAAAAGPLVEREVELPDGLDQILVGRHADAEGTATVARRLVSDLLADAADGAPTLHVVRGAAPKTLALVTVGRAYVVGRAEGCALPLGVEEVSREHATFVREAAGVVVRDLGSKNGVVVAGARVVGERALLDGDVVQIGPVTLRLDDPVGRYLRELETLPAPSPPEALAAPAVLAAPVALAVLAAHAAPESGVAAAPPIERRRAGSTQLVVGVAATVLVLLVVVALVLVFGRA